MASPLTTTQALALRCHDRIACREHLVASLKQCKQAQGEKVANEQQLAFDYPELHTTLHFYTLPLATVEVFLEQ
uniref:Uncharacterized protein n=1 Tax=Oryza nivara TaxID=4536 RepID=A0A0E0GB92_ORYNI